MNENKVQILIKTVQIIIVDATLQTLFLRFMNGMSIRMQNSSSLDHLNAY